MTMEKDFPPIMRNIGVPSEMSPLEEENDTPFVEIRQQLRFGENVEIRDQLSLSELLEEKFEIE